MSQDNRPFNRQGSAKFGWIGAAVLILLLIGIALWWNNYELPSRKQKQEQAKVEQPTAPAPVQTTASQQPQAAVPQTPPKQESAQAPVAKEEKKAEASVSKQKQNDAQATTAKQKEARATTVRRQDVVNTSTSRNAAPAFYYASQESCEAAVRAGKAVGYQPTARHVKYGDVRVAGFDRRPLEGDACVLLGAQPGRRWVFLPQGTMVYTSGPEVKFLAECQNDIYDVAYIRKEVAPPPAQPAAPAAPATVTIEKKVVEITKFFCQQGDRYVEAPIMNGVAKCPEIVAQNPIRIEAPVTVQPQAAPQQKVEAPCPGCYPEARVTNKVPRTDGRCVVAFRDPQGAMHYARFDTKRGTTLVTGAKVDNERGEWNMSHTPTYVGFISPTGEKKTVELKDPSCEAIVRSLVERRVFEWTGPRLGLAPNCTIVGQVREVPSGAH